MRTATGKACLARFVFALGIVFLAAMQGRSDDIYFAPAAEDNNLFWDNAGGWKRSSGFVNRLPNELDNVTLDSSKIALAGQGIDSPHALRITNGVKAVAKTLFIASTDSSSDASYAKTGRVIGLQIEDGGFLHTLDLASPSLRIGQSSAGYGVLNMTGGMISNYLVVVGNDGIGVMTNAGGTVVLSLTDSAVTLGRNADSKGTLVMTGGLLRHVGWNWNSSKIAVGQQGQGVFELSGGVVSNRVLLGTAVGGSGYVKMSGGTIVNRVFVGEASAKTNTFDFTGGTIVGDIFVGNSGNGRMIFDGGVHHVHTVFHRYIPGYTNGEQTYGMTVGNYAGSCGELIVKKPGLTFEISALNPALVCGRLGEGHVKTFVDLEIPYLRVGGNSDAMSSYTAYAASTTTVCKAAFAGGYGLYEPSTEQTDTYSGFGEIVLSNAVMRFTRDNTDVTTPQLYIGRDEESFGRLRGCGVVYGSTPEHNNARMALGAGQIIGDGYGEERTLDMNSVVSVTNLFANADNGTNGWYVVNKGAVLFPRVWFSTDSVSRCIGTWTRNEAPDLVNSVGFTLNNISNSGTAGHYVRGGLYAADRSDVHADVLPKGGEVVGIWKLGLFSQLLSLSEKKNFGSVGLTFRYDHTKVERGDRLKLYRWNGSAWTRVAAAKATDNPRISCSGLAPVSGETYNVGTFALMSRKPTGLSIIVF